MRKMFHWHEYYEVRVTFQGMPVNCRCGDKQLAWLSVPTCAVDKANPKQSLRKEVIARAQEYAADIGPGCRWTTAQVGQVVKGNQRRWKMYAYDGEVKPFKIMNRSQK